MLTIQTFLQKFFKLQIEQEKRKRFKYAFIILTYAFIAVILVLKLNVFSKGSKEVTEAFAAQKIIKTKEETKGFSEMDYLNKALGDSSLLGQPSILLTGSQKNHSGIDMSMSKISEYVGQVTLMSADVYLEDLQTSKKEDKVVIVPKKKETKQVQKKEKKESKSTTKKKVVESAKETMKTGSAVYSLSKKEIKILERIVEAEATGEDIKGKILVANVIMNRVNDAAFPDSVEAVVFQKTGNKYQFSPISDKRYYSVTVSEGTKEAVKRVMKGEDYSQGALYFSARKRASASNMKWFDTKLKWLFQYGNHEFFKHK